MHCAIFFNIVKVTWHFMKKKPPARIFINNLGARRQGENPFHSRKNFQYKRTLEIVQNPLCAADASLLSMQNVFLSFVV